MRDLDANDRKLIFEAKKKELATFMQYKAIKMLSRQGISKNKLVPMKWVLTWKEVDEDGTKKKKGKARLGCHWIQRSGISDISSRSTNSKQSSPKCSTSSCSRS